MKLVLITLIFSVLLSTVRVTANSDAEVMKIIRILKCARITNKVIQIAGKAAFQYNIQGRGKTTYFYLDFKHSPAKIALGVYRSGSPDAVLSLSDKNFVSIMKRELSAPWAYLTGKVKVKGKLSSARNLVKALLELEKGITNYSGSY